MEKKPWYKKFKVLVAIATGLIEVIIAMLGEKITPEYISLMHYLAAVAIALISGHALTDAVSALKKKE